MAKASKLKRSTSAKNYFAGYSARAPLKRRARIERHLKNHPEDGTARKALKGDLAHRSGKRRKGHRNSSKVIYLNRLVAEGKRALKTGAFKKQTQS